MLLAYTVIIPVLPIGLVACVTMHNLNEYCSYAQTCTIFIGYQCKVY